MTLGAWAMNPSRSDLELAARLGMRRIDLMVNDHSKDRAVTRFRCYEGVESDIRIARELGLEVHLTSWLMPHETFIVEATDRLRDLSEQCTEGDRPTSVLWDAEEPWTQADEGMPVTHAADFAHECLKGVPMGVTGIGYADLDLDTPELDGKLEALVLHADYVVPQAYVVAPSSPERKTLTHRGMPRVFERWAAAGKPVVAGLAAYRQADIDGCNTVGGAIRKSLQVARAHGCEAAIYWALRHIAGSWRVQRAIAEATAVKAAA